MVIYESDVSGAIGTLTVALTYARLGALAGKTPFSTDFTAKHPNVQYGRVRPQEPSERRGGRNRTREGPQFAQESL